jgi:DNA-binding transcriptional ArsR family regulator
MRLRAEGIVEARREGRHMLYRLARPEIAELISALRRAF